MDTVLIVGFPNSGKSLLFNNLTGQRRKVSNYCGITVDSAQGELKSNQYNPRQVKIVDLPGIYSLVPNSLDEAVTASSLAGTNAAIGPYNLIAQVLDMDRLEASLSLALSLKKNFSKNLVLIINKDDQREFRQDHIDKLQELTGLKVISTSALRGSSLQVDKFIRDNITDEKAGPSDPIKLTKKALEFFPEQTNNKSIVFSEDENDILAEIDQFQRIARQIIDQVHTHVKEKALLSRKIDQFVLHPIIGTIIFFGLFYLIFHSIYTWSGPLMDLIDSSVGTLSTFLANSLPEGLFNSFVVDGVIAGVGGVIIFLPQIMILFFLLSLLEQSGYIGRGAVLTDRLMAVFGLNGKAFLPFLSGFACAVPAMMATRSIANKNERMATLLTIPLITCSARLPVYILLIGTFIPSVTVLGLFNSQALAFFFLYFLGSVFALVMAKIFRLSLFKGQSKESFMIDLPHYQRPSLLAALKQSWHKGRIFLKKAGTIILFLSMVIWLLSTFPRPQSSVLEGKNPEQQAALELEHSAMGKLGKAIEPIIKPLGYDWKMGVGILVAFGARELFVSTLGTLYALGDVDEESQGLRERLKSEIDPVTGHPVFNLAVAWSLLIFFVFSLQCTSTLAIARREFGNWKYPIMMFVYMGALGYLGAFLTYRLLI